MVHRIQRLKSNRGFSMVELIVVVLIIGIMATTVLAGSSNRREKILEGNTAASDFYSALQAEFTNFQMFDGPLTMSLHEKYVDTGATGLTSISAGDNYSGMKYFPAVGGNYPYADYDGQAHATGLPSEAETALYLEFYVFSGKLIRVNYENDLGALLAMEKTGGNDGAELCAILVQEMKDRMEYRDGYYYARVSYSAPSLDPSKTPTKYDYRMKPVLVDWAAYCASEITNADADNTVFQMQNMLRSNGVCGVHTTNRFRNLGTTGTDFLSEGVNPA